MRTRVCPKICFVLCLFLAGFSGTWAARGLDAPYVSAVSPQAGITTPGSRIVVYGSGFAPDALVYFGGLEAREIRFLSSTRIEAVTPYLRPGPYQIQVKTVGVIVRSEVTFTATPSQVDSEIDRAVALSTQGQSPAAISILTAITKTDDDYQVRSFAYYQLGQIYFALGDWWRWAGESTGIFLDAAKSGRAVQTNWRYRLVTSEADYLLNSNKKPDGDLRVADFVIQYDVTENPEPRFFRSLLNARYGNLPKAKIDSDFILKADRTNPSYQALAAYIGVLRGDSSLLQSFSGRQINDARALRLLAEAAQLSGDAEGAKQWWSQAGQADPLGARLTCLAGRKHLARGHQQVAKALINGCTIMAPDSKEAKEVQNLLAK